MSGKKGKRERKAAESGSRNSRSDQSPEAQAKRTQRARLAGLASAVATTPEQRRERASKAGKASAAVRRARRDAGLPEPLTRRIGNRDAAGPSFEQLRPYLDTLATDPRFETSSQIDLRRQATAMLRADIAKMEWDAIRDR